MRWKNHPLNTFKVDIFLLLFLLWTLIFLCIIDKFHCTMHCRMPGSVTWMKYLSSSARFSNLMMKSYSISGEHTEHISDMGIQCSSIKPASFKRRDKLKINLFWSSSSQNLHCDIDCLCLYLSQEWPWQTPRMLAPCLTAPDCAQATHCCPSSHRTHARTSGCLGPCTCIIIVIIIIISTSQSMYLATIAFPYLS